MTHRLRLKIASVSFAVLWTIWMLWWSSPLRPAEVVIIGACGVVIGFAWHLLYGRWYRWHLARKVFPRRQSR
jgi:hypothetical protein